MLKDSLVFFFFKQKTAYEMRISDWSSDVCSSDLRENAMQLTAAQLADFDERGFLFMPHCFGAEEVALLRREAEAIYRLDRQEIWREKSGAPRTAFAAHTFNEAFGILGRHPRLIEPVEQLLGEHLYMHQDRKSK